MPLTAAGFASTLAAGLAASSYTTASIIHSGSSSTLSEQYSDYERRSNDAIGVPVAGSKAKGKAASFRYTSHSTSSSKKVLNAMEFVRDEIEAGLSSKMASIRKSLLKRFKKSAPLLDPLPEYYLSNMHQLNYN